MTTSEERERLLEEQVEQWKTLAMRTVNTLRDIDAKLKDVVKIQAAMVKRPITSDEQILEVMKRCKDWIASIYLSRTTEQEVNGAADIITELVEIIEKMTATHARVRDRMENTDGHD